MTDIAPKYRMLTNDELQELEKEFIEFLVLNGIVADDWEKIKKEEKQVAENLIILFSDVVIEGSMRKIKFLEFRHRNEILMFQCLPEKIVLVGLESSDKSVDFSKDELLNLAESPDLSVYTKEKDYKESREMELFKMVQNGSMISDGSLFKKCAALL